MLDTISDIEVFEESLTDQQVSCEHSRHSFDPHWHDEGNGCWDVIVFCANCGPKAVVFCSGYVQKRILMYPYDVVWCHICKGRMPINESYQIIGRID